jgi:hypothetical protein
MLEIVWRNPDKFTTTSRSVDKTGSDVTRPGLTLLTLNPVATLNSLSVAHRKDVPPEAETLDQRQAMDKMEKTK